MKTFVDTNVLVYAHDTDAGDRHATARALLAELWDGRSGSLSTQVLQEFYAVVTRKFKPAMTREKARAIVAAARARGLEILHYDLDFETIARFTEQPARWIVSPGTV